MGQDIIERIVHAGIIAVVRARSAGQIPALAEALISGGVPVIEITLSTPKAIDAIRAARKALGDRAVIGVGTVLQESECESAIHAGAQFVVSPIMRPQLARVARAHDVCSMLGAYTPTEAQLAHEAGSDFVKIFPADGLGPAYIKALRAPLPHLRLVPTGIARPEQIGEFLKAGCAAVGLGSLLLTGQILHDDDWNSLQQNARRFRQLVDQARRGTIGP